MDDAQTGLKAKDAIDAGFRYFREFFDKQDTQNVLLEGVEFLEKEELWLITIGFDLTWTRDDFDNPLGRFAFLGGEKERRSTRESREFTLRNSDGSCVRMRTP